MLQIGGDLDLLQEPLGAEHGRQLRPQHLDRHLAVVAVAQIVGKVDRSHPPLTERTLDAVTVREGGGEPGQLFGHYRQDTVNVSKGE